MNRRKFVSDTFLLAGSSCILTPIAFNNFSMEVERSGFKRLLDLEDLQVKRIPADISKYVDRIDDLLIKSYDRQAYTYDDHYIIKVKTQKTIFSERGLLFITSSGKHTYLSERYIKELDDLIVSYTEGLQSHDIHSRATDFLLPHEITKYDASPFSFMNKYGNTITLILKGDNSRLFIK